MLTYLVVPFSILLLGIAARKWLNSKMVSTAGILCGLIAIVFVGRLIADLSSEYIGLFQRIIEGSILFWIIICAMHIRNYYKLLQLQLTT